MTSSTRVALVSIAGASLVALVVALAVGAGDAFCAGLVSGLLDGKTLQEAVQRGAALGAFCVSTFGDYQGLPTRSELETFMEGKVVHGR